MRTITYDRSRDTATFYMDGVQFGNYTNYMGQENWSSSEFATKFGYFGRVSDTDDNGIEAFSVGCRSGDLADISSMRGGEIGRGAKRRADNVSVRNEILTRWYLHTRRTSSPTTAIILTDHSNPFRDSLRSSQAWTTWPSTTGTSRLPKSKPSTMTAAHLTLPSTLALPSITISMIRPPTQCSTRPLAPRVSTLSSLDLINSQPRPCLLQTTLTTLVQP